jgi:hypothetical protein
LAAIFHLFRSVYRRRKEATELLGFNASHVAGVWSSSVLRPCYLNGVAATDTATNDVTGDSSNEFTVGCFYNGSATLQGFLNGSVAFPAAWGSALTATDIGALYAKASPLLVQPGNLLEYYRLTGGRSHEPSVLST